jgi:ABC-2 type transport system ATP-binding protein
VTSMLIDIEGLTVDYPAQEGLLHAVRGVSLQIVPGEILGIVGESGCGKTTLAYALLGDLGRNAKVGGVARLAGRDILAMSEAELRSMRGRRVAMVPQNPGEALNPARRIGDQLREILAVHAGLTGKDAAARITALLEKVHLPDPQGIMRRWPHELSGGQQQRLVIAMALLGGPELLVLDEPTTGLDPRSRQVVWQTVRELVSEGITLLLTTQYLEEADALADHIVLIDHGREIAKGTPSQLKSLVGDQRVDVVAEDHPGYERLKAALEPSGFEMTFQPEDRRISIPAPYEIEDLNRVAAAVAAADLPIDEIALRRPTLDDAFIKLTGHAAEEQPAGEDLTV